MAVTAQLQSILDSVYELSKRPDLSAETLSRVKKATLKLHMSDFFVQDKKKVTLTLASSSTYRYTIDTTAIEVPRFRKASYIRQYVFPATGYEKQYSLVESDEIFDEYLLEKTNYFYQAGSVINIRSNIELTQVNLGYFQYPNLVDESYFSWIADQTPQYIVEETLATLFGLIGKDTEARYYRALANENIVLLKMTGLLSGV